MATAEKLFSKIPLDFLKFGMLSFNNCGDRAGLVSGERSALHAEQSCLESVHETGAHKPQEISKGGDLCLEFGQLRL